MLTSYTKKNLGLTSGLIGVMVYFAAMSLGYGNKAKGYLETCTKGVDYCDTGLVCAIAQGHSSGTCVHSCMSNGKICPHKEPCKMQGGAAAGCICSSNQDCPKGEVCKNLQCGGYRLPGETCSEDLPCVHRHICAKPKDAKERVCLPICTRSVCSNQLPCVLNGEFGVCFCRNHKECRYGSPTALCINGLCKKSANIGEECTSMVPCINGTRCVYPPGESTGRCQLTCPKGQSDCYGGELCVDKGGSHVCYCDARVKCANGRTCVNGSCGGVTHCNNSKTCGKDEVCLNTRSNSDLGVCTKSCQSDKDCKEDGLKCMYWGSKRACSCKKSSDCKSFHLCRNFRCIPMDAENVGDGGGYTPDSVTDKKEPPVVDPNCKPACKENEVCRNKKCVKKDVGEHCTKNEECNSSYCFKYKPPLYSICSISDCQKCIDYNYECALVLGKRGCVPKAPPRPDTKTENTVGCCQSSPGPNWLPLMILFLFFFRLFRRL